tara:strand:- start:105 stop:578 length:474 start_codon:yes stop_codon:yes gene_type:complete
MEKKYWKSSSTYFYSGNYKDAIDALKVYSYFDKENPEVYERLGSCYYLIGENKKAIDSWTTALFFAPDNKDLKKIIKKTEKALEDEKKYWKDRKNKKATKKAMPEGKMQLMGSFPTQEKAYAQAQKLKTSGLEAYVEENDDGKWEVKVPQDQLKKKK